MEKFIYIGSLTGNISLVYPAESWRGAHPASDNTLNLYFTPIVEGGLFPDKDNDVITIETTDDNKHKEVIEALVNEINHGDSHVTVLIDKDSGESVHSQISGVTATFSSDV